MDQRDIGKFIASCRKNKEMTQSELTEKLGVSINAVSKWERGINLPDYSNLQELCSVLGISLNEFFAGRLLLYLRLWTYTKTASDEILCRNTKKFLKNS